MKRCVFFALAVINNSYRSVWKQSDRWVLISSSKQPFAFSYRVWHRVSDGTNSIREKNVAETLKYLAKKTEDNMQQAGEGAGVVANLPGIGVRRLSFTK